MVGENIAGDGIGRRQVLKRTGAGLVGLGTFTTGASATTDDERLFDRIYERARELRRRTGRHDLFVKYLESHLISVDSESRTLHITRDEGVSTEWLRKTDLKTKMSLIQKHFCSYSVAYVDYYVDIETDWSAGEGGPDDITISWNDDHYRILDGEWYQEGSNVEYHRSQLNGIDWKFHDGHACGITCDTSIAVGAKIRLLDTDQDRAVRGKYHHAWAGEEYNGFSVSSSGGVSWSSAPTQKGWEGKYQTVSEARWENGPDEEFDETYYCGP